jgi:hypothetical protein
MTIDKKDWLASLPEKKVSPEQVTAAKTISRQAVNMKHLTNDPNWDMFLSFIQSTLDEAEVMMAYYTEALQSVKTKDEDMAQLKRGYLVSNERYNILTNLIELPKAIIEDGETAKDLLARLEDGSKD